MGNSNLWGERKKPCTICRINLLNHINIKTYLISANPTIGGGMENFNAGQETISSGNRSLGYPIDFVIVGALICVHYRVPFWSEF